MNDKTSINSTYPNLWAPTAGLLQDLTVLQQCVYQISLGMFVKSEVTSRACIGLEQNIIDTAVNEWRKHLLACVCIVDQHFKQFYCRPLKNGQLDELSASISEMRTKCVFTQYVN